MSKNQTPDFNARGYAKIAEALRQHVLLHSEIMTLVIDDLSKVFEADNPRFNKQTFLKECGLWG